MPTLNIDGVGRVEVDDSFLSLSPEQQSATVEEIVASHRKSQPDSLFSRAKTPGLLKSKDTLNETSALGAAGRAAMREAIPTAAGIVGFGAGAAAGASAVAPLAPFTGPAAPFVLGAGGLVGGLVGGFGAGYGARKVQDAITYFVPEDVKAKFGQNAAQQEADRRLHPTATFVGELAPQVAAFRPGGLSKAAMAVGSGIAGTAEAVRQKASGEEIDPTKIAIATGAGAFLNKETALGRGLMNAGAKVGDKSVQAAQDLAKSPTQRFADKQVRNNPYAAYDAEIVQELRAALDKTAIVGSNGKRLSRRDRDDITVKQINALENSFATQAKTMIAHLDIPPSQKTRVIKALEERHIISVDELNSLRGTVEGDAVADAVIKTQRLRELTPEIKSGGFKGFVREAVNISSGTVAAHIAPWLSVPAYESTRRLMARFGGGEATRANAAADLIAKEKKYRRVSEITGPSGQRESQKRLEDAYKETVDSEYYAKKARQEEDDLARAGRQEEAARKAQARLEREAEIARKREERQQQQEALRQGRLESGAHLQELVGSKYDISAADTILAHMDKAGGMGSTLAAKVRRGEKLTSTEKGIVDTYVKQLERDQMLEPFKATSGKTRTPEEEQAALARQAADNEKRRAAGTNYKAINAERYSPENQQLAFDSFRQTYPQWANLVDDLQAGAKLSRSDLDLIKAHFAKLEQEGTISRLEVPKPEKPPKVPKRSPEDIAIERNIAQGIQGSGEAVASLGVGVGRAKNLPPVPKEKVLEALAAIKDDLPELAEDITRLQNGYATKRKSFSVLAPRIAKYLEDTGFIEQHRKAAADAAAAAEAKKQEAAKITEQKKAQASEKVKKAVPKATSPILNEVMTPQPQAQAQPQPEPQPALSEATVSAPRHRKVDRKQHWERAKAENQQRHDRVVDELLWSNPDVSADVMAELAPHLRNIREQRRYATGDSVRILMEELLEKLPIKSEAERKAIEEAFAEIARNKPYQTKADYDAGVYE